MTTSGNVREGISIALGILGTILIWQLSRELLAANKRALYYWLAAGLLGYTRWIFIDAAFDLNIISMAVLIFAVVLTLRIAIWTRSGVLT